MFRKLSLFLAIIFIFTMAIPISGFAEEMDKGLENAIKIAKTKFEIPENYKFTSDIYMESNEKIFNLNWTDPNKNVYKNISVRINEKGKILNYSKYNSLDDKSGGKLPKLSRQEAKLKADGYIEAIEKGLLSSLKYREETAKDNILNSSYYITYYRIINAVPFYNDSVSVSLSKQTGELLDYSCSWTDGLVFPSIDNIIPIEKAEKPYSDKLGFKLIYRYTNKDDQLKAFAVYVPIYGNSDYGVDAVTGEKQRISSWRYYTSEENGYAQKSAVMAAAAGADEIVLNPDELEAVSEASKLLSKEKVESIARGSVFLNITSEFKLENAYLNKNWPEKNYVWRLYFTKKDAADESKQYYTYVTIDAKTGAIIGFNIEGLSQPETTIQYDIDKTKEKADAFLNKYYGDYYKQVEYDKSSNEYVYSADNKNIICSFRYNRIVNGTEFPDNSITVTYDNISGIVTGFNLNWFSSIQFPSVANAIGVAAAAEGFFNNIGLELQYKYKFTDATTEESKPELVPVYVLKDNKPLFIDVNTGKLLDYNGEEYKESKPVSYTDIDTHYARKYINVLADNGIYLEGSEFKPNSAITQIDFLMLLSKALGYYGDVIINKDSTEKEINDLYSYLTRQGIIKDGEKTPNSEITREEAIKYAIRALKYDKVADIKGIYNCSFADKDKIDEKLVGYVTIAAGLGLVSNNSSSFRPKDKLKRAEGAIIIYNYLQL